MQHTISSCHCKMRPCHHRNWKPLTDTHWMEFHEEWWGSASFKDRRSDPLGERIIHVSQAPVYLAFGHLHDTSGGMLLRDDIMDTYHRMQKAQLIGVDGIALVGSGIGVSITGIIILLCQMAERRASLFTSKFKQTFLIDESGLWTMDASTFEYARDGSGDGPLYEESTRTWSIIDSQDDTDRRLSSYLFSHLLFPIYTVPPRMELYRHWRNHCNVVQWLLAPWTNEELLESLKLNIAFQHHAVLHTSDKQVALAFVADHVRQSGPFPGDLRDQLLSKHARCENPDLDGLLGMLWTAFTSPPSTYRQFISINREAPSTSDDDPFYLDFKSEEVFSALAQRSTPLTMLMVRNFLESCPVIPEISLLGGWVLESLAIRYLCMEDFPHGRHSIHPSAQMSCVSGQSSRFTHTSRQERAGHPKPLKPVVLVMDNNGASIRKNGNKLFSRRPVLRSNTILPTSNLSLIPMKPRQIKVYSSLNQVALDDSLYFPLKRDNALFDAFFFDFPDTNRAVIWMIQMAAPALSQDSNGLDVVRALRHKLAAKWTVEVKYVLVVPLRWHWTVEWDMPPGWCHEDVAGDVYVQYLHLGHITRSNPWNYAYC